MVQPISLLMSHFNVENTARLTPAALAASQDTVQSQELVKDSIRVTETVQASDAAAEDQKVHRRTEDEEREDHRRNSQSFDSFEKDEESKEEKKEESEIVTAPKIPEVRAENRGFDFYV